MRNLVLAVLAIMVFVSPAFADKANHGKKHGHGDVKSAGHGTRKDTVILIPTSDKGKILSFLKDSHKKKCPPGLAKKNNGCLPPGQAKHYTIGKRLAVDTRSVPQKLLDILSPPPQGTFYRMVDNDVVLISQRDQQVMDAVSLLSALQ